MALKDPARCRRTWSSGRTGRDCLGGSSTAARSRLPRDDHDPGFAARPRTHARAWWPPPKTARQTARTGLSVPLRH